MPDHQNSRRGFLANLAAAPLVAAPQLTAAKPLNIVYLHSHDSGRYLPPYGYAVPTPTFAGLAAEGVLFRRAFSAAPTCSPSRAALLTGQCAHSTACSAWRTAASPDRLPPPHRAHAARCGLSSVLAGLQHIAVKPERMATTRFWHPATTQAVDVAPQAAAFLDSQAEALSSWTSASSRRIAYSPTRTRGRPALHSAAGAHRRHARDSRRYGRLQGQRARSRSRHRRGSRRSREWSGGEHPCHLHDGSRPCVSSHEVQPERSRFGRFANSAGSGRLRRRQGLRCHGLPDRRVSDRLRVARDRRPAWLEGKSLMPLVADAPGRCMTKSSPK